MTHLRGRVSSVSWRDDFTGETLARIAPEGKNPRKLSYAFWGSFATGFSPGECLTLYGEWHQHPRNGKVFRVSRIERHPPTTPEGEINYLAGAIVGLSKKQARELIEWAGSLDEVIRICKEQPARLEEVLPRARKLRARLRNAQWDRQDVDIDAFVALQSAGLKIGQIQQLAKWFGPSALRRVAQHSPYDMCQVPKVGFASAERVARFYAEQQGRQIDLFNEERLVYGLCDVAARERNHGHVCTPEDRLIQHALRHLQLPRTREAVTKLQDALGAALKRRLLVKDYGQIYTRGLHKAETDLALRIGKLMVSGARPLSMSETAIRRALQGSGLSDEQVNAVVLLATSPVSLLVGGPGRGKTRTLKSFVDLLDQNRRSYLLLAPTGKAAKRASEVTGKPAFTIHKACGLDREEDVHSKKYGRKISRREKLSADVVIVDEASMIDLALMFELVRRIRAGRTALVLVGDPDQLPPVSAGQVLVDMLRAGTIPTGRLTQVFRQAGGSPIVDGADAINRGELPEFQTQGHEVRLFDPLAAKGHPGRHLSELALDHEIRTTLNWLRQAVLRYAKDLDLDPLRDIQIYAPQRTGPLGLQVLNEMLQDVLNPATSRTNVAGLKIADGFTVRVGDKVMQVRNNYRLRYASASQQVIQAGRTKKSFADLPEAVQTAHVPVMNGQIGIIRRVDAVKSEIEVEFDDMPEPVLYLRSDEWRELAPAYAMSIHRSQGSETPYAFIVLHDSMNSSLVNRPLLYTGWTRAKAGVAVFAPKIAVARAAASTQGTERFSNLNQRLQQTTRAPRSRGRIIVGG